MSTWPDYVVWFRGRPACPCLAEWLPAYERELQRRGILKGSLTIYQLIGLAGASANTHSRGGAFDLVDMPGGDDVWVARQMGADATWSRTAAQGFTPPHIHGVLTGCEHNSPARYQIDEVRADRNGLASRGKDDGPRPLSGRTWREGIEWAKQQEDDMPFTEEQLRAIVREEVEAVLAKEQKNGRNLRANIIAIARKVGVNPAED